MVCHVCASRLVAAPPASAPASVQVVVHTGAPAPPAIVGRRGLPGQTPLPPRVMMRPAVPIPPLRKRTTGQKFAWVPLAGGFWSMVMFSGGTWEMIAAIPVAAASLAAGWWLFKRHGRERRQNRALKVFRALQTVEVTKDQIVRDHGVDPEEAEEVLTWLVANELLTADWDQLDGPIVYRRTGAG